MHRIKVEQWKMACEHNVQYKADGAEDEDEDGYDDTSMEMEMERDYFGPQD